MTKTVANKEPRTFRNAFIGHAKQPAPREVSGALGGAESLWNQLLAELTADHKLTREWNSHSIKAGWSLRLKRLERNIVYLSPSRGGFIASLALGDKAIQAARTSDLPSQVLKAIAGAKKYAEGTAVRIEVKGTEDLAAIKKLVEIKLAN
jgi:Protein of unknown function (DUF3788)